MAARAATMRSLLMSSLLVASAGTQCALSSGIDMMLHPLSGKNLSFVGATPLVTYVPGKPGSSPVMTITGYSSMPVIQSASTAIQVSVEACAAAGMSSTTGVMAGSTTAAGMSSTTGVMAGSTTDDADASAACRRERNLGYIVAGLGVAAVAENSVGRAAGLALAGLGAGACVDASEQVTSAGDNDSACEHVVEVTIMVPDTEEQVRSYWLIGESVARIPEASEPSLPSHCADGADGDVDFPHGNLKPIATVGECISSDFCINGVPDGNGAMLKDDSTVRIISQSESYGPITAFESVPWHVNSNAASFTGSHIQYVDYDREKMANFMSSTLPASDMVVGAGDVVETAYNLKGELVGPRNLNGATTTGAHYSNTDAAGNYVIVREPSVADWIMQSLCAAHLEEKHQWGAGIGVEDDIFITNEEWITLATDVDFTGLASHVVDLATKTSYAAGVFTLGGFEKIVEVSTGTTDYVAFAPSGYNGAWFSQKTWDARNSAYNRSDGNPYVWPKYVVPSRLYIGKKGYNAQGQPDTSSFLARNGLAYGQLYGFAVNATGFEARDAWHQAHYNGDTMEGGFYPISWMWDGTVRNFEHDGSWEFQDDPVNGAGMQFWNGGGKDAAGAKTEHVSPDPHDGFGYWQGSTAGYVGKYDFPQITSILQALGANEDFPTHVPSTYTLLQGETDVVDLIDLNGKGVTTSDVGDQTQNCDRGASSCRTTFEDIDGLEAFAVGDKTYIMIQEDSGNDYGERMLITEATFDRGNSTANKVFKFVAQSGGVDNTRMNIPCSVGVPAATWGGSGSHEFSGITDISGLLRKEGGSFALQASDTGYEKREQDKLVTDVNEKIILVGLQAHNLVSGDIRRFGADRGGQWLLFQPQL